MHTHPNPRHQITAAIALCAMVLSTVTPLMSEPAHPTWWNDRNVKNANPAQNRGAANIGQLKNIATQAHAELENLLPGGAGFDLPFDQPPTNPDATWYQNQKKILQLGVLKRVAKDFYDRLNGISPEWVKEQLNVNGLDVLDTNYFKDATTGYYYPWNPSTPAAENYKPASVGQLKLVFCLRFGESLDGDTAPDLLEQEVFGTTIYTVTEAQAQQIQNGTDPGTLDLDNDGLVNALDAMPGDADMAWEKSPVHRYAIIELKNEESLPGVDYDDPYFVRQYKVNSRGEVLSSDSGHHAGIWDPKNDQWIAVPSVQSPVYPELMVHPQVLGLGDDGTVVGTHFIDNFYRFSSNAYTWKIGEQPQSLVGLAGQGGVVSETAGYQAVDVDGLGRIYGTGERGMVGHAITRWGQGGVEEVIGSDTQDYNLLRVSHDGVPLYTQYNNGSYVLKLGNETIDIIENLQTLYPSPRVAFQKLPLMHRPLITLEDSLWVNRSGSWVEKTLYADKEKTLSIESLNHVTDDGSVLGYLRHGVFKHVIWRNGEATPLEDLVSDDRFVNISPRDMAPNGIIVAEALKIKDDNGNDLPFADQENKPVLLLPVDIVPDYDRDGKIDQEDRGRVTEANPWRWWINDDDDKAVEERKVTGLDVPFQSEGSRDCNDLIVDGIRDLIDFFPLHLDLKHTLEIFPSSDYKYLLKHEEEAVKFFEFPAGIPDGSDDAYAPDAHWKHAIRARGNKAKPLILASSSGAELTAQMLSKAKDGQGLIIMEAAKLTDKPLILEIIKKSDQGSVAEIKFPLAITNVQWMYRTVNLRDIGIQADASTQWIQTDKEEPFVNQDDLCNSKYFMFLHGFNVDCYKAQGWNAELFKRMHQMGSKARFVGVTWYGNPPAPVSATNDYHKAVTNAFMVGDQLASKLSFANGSDVTIAAHSLGNMVVSQAISRAGFNPSRYYMINAATPIEAYDPTQQLGSDLTPMASRMIEDDWKPYHALRPSLLASYWNTLFDPATDARGKLTWRGLFSTQLPVADQGKILANTYNFYSRGDDVVENAEASEQLGTTIVAQLTAAWSPDVTVTQALARHAWVNQEIVKGGQNILAHVLIDDIHGGWEFNYQAGQYFPGAPPLEGYYKWEVNPNGPTFSRRYTAQEAADQTDISDANLQTKPFYDLFKYAGLYNNTQGSSVATLPAVRYNLLATAIPASSYAVAPNAIDKLTNHPLGNRNHHMQVDLKAIDQHGTVFWLENDPTYNGKWIHSDFRDVAATYVWPMYEKMINLGSLKNN